MATKTPGGSLYPSHAPLWCRAAGAVAALPGAIQGEAGAPQTPLLLLFPEIRDPSTPLTELEVWRAQYPVKVSSRRPDSHRRRQSHLDVWVPARPNRLKTSRFCPAQPGRAFRLAILGVRKRSTTPKSPPGGAVSLAWIPLRL